MVSPSARLSSATTRTAVQERVDGAIQDLASLWDRTAGRTADVLGDHDLPWLIECAAGGGKMIRPEMVHWGWVAAGAPEDAWTAVVDLGAAMELLHLFALIHDDVMDRSLLRRGRPTTHELARRAHVAAGARGDAVAFGDSIAILAGDLLQSEAGHLVARLPTTVVEAWRVMMIELVLGQRRDLTGAASGRRDREHALEVARLKSGAYTVAGPLRMGALVARAPSALLEVLDRYAWHAGEAFALRDDVLGVWGDPTSTGKSIDDDLSAGKATVLLALAQERVHPDGKDLLVGASHGALDAEQVAALRHEMECCGVRDLVEDMIHDQVGRACDALSPGVVSPEGIAGLTAMAQRIAWRQS